MIFPRACLEGWLGRFHLRSTWAEDTGLLDASEQSILTRPPSFVVLEVMPVVAIDCFEAEVDRSFVVIVAVDGDNELMAYIGVQRITESVDSICLDRTCHRYKPHLCDTFDADVAFFILRDHVQTLDVMRWPDREHQMSSWRQLLD